MSDVPRLPAGFTDTFESRLVDTGDVRLHAVVGGSGPALLLVGGWPQTWYAWRLVMPALAEGRTVIAVDPRGVGRSDKPVGGYDTGTLAADLVALMGALGHERFSLVGHDIGMWVGYALAADHPGALDRLAVAEAAIPGISPAPPIFNRPEVNARLWHFGFNRLPAELNEELVRGRERAFFGHQFASKAVTPLPEHAVDLYVTTLADSADALRASFEPYRALHETMLQNQARSERPLELPVLAIAGARGSGSLVEDTMRSVASDVTAASVEDCGHYPAEEQPERTLALLREFLAPAHEVHR